MLPPTFDQHVSAIYFSRFPFLFYSIFIVTLCGNLRPNSVLICSTFPTLFQHPRLNNLLSGMPHTLLNFLSFSNLKSDLEKHHRYLQVHNRSVVGSNSIRSFKLIKRCKTLFHKGINWVGITAVVAAVVYAIGTHYLFVYLLICFPTQFVIRKNPKGPE